MNAPPGWGGGASPAPPPRHCGRAARFAIVGASRPSRARSAAWRGCLRASICLSAAVRFPTDYVLVRGATREAELAAGFEPVFFEPRGLIEAWRPRARTASR